MVLVYNKGLKNKDIKAAEMVLEENHDLAIAKWKEYFGLKDRYEALDKYVLDGGMSGSYLYKDQEAKYDYIADVFDTLIVRAENRSL